MKTRSLPSLARADLVEAQRSHAGRAATTVSGGHERVMRQTLITLTADSVLNEHENPGEATLYVVSGEIELVAGDDRCQASEGDLVEIPPERHSLRALADSTVLLTAVPLPR